jgi:hypothetical protein
MLTDAGKQVLTVCVLQCYSYIVSSGFIALEVS